MRSANRSRGKPPPTRSGAACSGKNSKSPPSSPDAINRPLTRIRHGDSRHRNRNAQYLAGPSSKDFQALTPTKRGPKAAVRGPLAAELAQAKRENARLEQRLERAEAIIEIQKKLQRCWVFRWRLQTATTCHDGRDRLFGTKAGSDRRRLRGHERVARQHLPSARRSGPTTRHASPQAEPTARAGGAGTPSRARPSARAALC